MTRQVSSTWGELTLTEEKDVDATIKRLVQSKKIEDSFYIFNPIAAIEKYEKWTTLLPNIKPFYAVKCNPDVMLLKIFACLGSGFDCASEDELDKILTFGVDVDSIILANPIKTPRQLSYLSKVNVKKMTFDNSSELYKINKYHPNAQLLLRIRSDSMECARNLGEKFGSEPDDVGPLLKLAKELNLNIVGVAFHVGSNCLEASAYDRAIEAARKVFDKARAVGFHPHLLNIGGGFQDSVQVPFEQIAISINQSLAKNFPPEMKVTFIAEPGRFFAAEAFTLLTQVVGKHEKKNGPHSLDAAKYYVNNGIYSSFFGVTSSLVEAHPHYFKDSNQNDMVKATMYGQTCDGFDKVMAERTIPRLEIGDWICWSNMGAYSLSMATNFNGFPFPRIYRIVPQNSWSTLKPLLSEK